MSVSVSVSVCVCVCVCVCVYRIDCVLRLFMRLVGGGETHSSNTPSGQTRKRWVHDTVLSFYHNYDGTIL